MFIGIIGGLVRLIKCFIIFAITMLLLLVSTSFLADFKTDTPITLHFVGLYICVYVCVCVCVCMHACVCV